MRQSIGGTKVFFIHFKHVLVSHRFGVDIHMNLKNISFKKNPK